jgi:hypothetical protein
MSLQPTRTPIVPDGSQFIVEGVNEKTDAADRFVAQSGRSDDHGTRAGNPVYRTSFHPF